MITLVSWSVVLFSYYALKKKRANNVDLSKESADQIFGKLIYTYLKMLKIAGIVVMVILVIKLLVDYLVG